MKIIQIMTGPESGEGGTDHVIYGLGDNGMLYMFCAERAPWARIPSGKYAQKCTSSIDEISAAQGAGDLVQFYTGCTNGWKPLCSSDERYDVLYHPLDPAMP